MSRGDELLSKHGITPPDVDTPDDTSGGQETATLPAAPEFPHDKASGPLREIMDWALDDGLPVSMVAASAEVSVASAAAGRIGPDGSSRDLGARLRITATRIIRSVLWEALIAVSGAGKNPSINAGLVPQTRYYDTLMENWEALCQLVTDPNGVMPPRPQALMQSSVGIEPMARWLAKTGGAGVVRNGELASFLRGLGQYKAGGG
ncbi:MAG TPA: hypothetical protein VMU94_09005, partial [Streptosporangiaceae bacterium]|nr:hypothetical protein [Streptosporangiaceae bacterium]